MQVQMYICVNDGECMIVHVDVEDAVYGGHNLIDWRGSCLMYPQQMHLSRRVIEACSSVAVWMTSLGQCY